VPLPFVHTWAPIYLAGVARPGPTLRDNVAVQAMARIPLQGRISNIQTSWVKLGIDRPVRERTTNYAPVPPRSRRPTRCPGARS
jgi:hypothetical protein